MQDDATEQLVQRAQGGDRDAAGQLLQQHLSGLRAFVRAKSGELIRQRESCSDLVQTVCREALDAIGEYQWRGAASFRNWLFTVALNKIRGRADYYGAERRDARREAGGDDALAFAYASMFGPSQHAIAAEAVADFERALDLLSDEHREIIVLSRMVGLDHGEIAEQLGIERATVRTRLARALSRLATAMAKATG